jgi:phosphoribosylformylglycinamidine cyclo-ligase
VDITAGYRAVELMKSHVARTLTPGVIGDMGGFGGLFAPELTGMAEPVLVSGTDGVGTKLKLAFLLDKHDTVGIDCVAMCVNDIICCGARPLFFPGLHRLRQKRAGADSLLVSGVAEGCVQAGCALIGGETAEMPGFYPRTNTTWPASPWASWTGRRSWTTPPWARATPSSRCRPPALTPTAFPWCASALDVENAGPGRALRGSGRRDHGRRAAAPTRIYVKPMLALMERVTVKAVSHITGGGFFENIPRSLPEGLFREDRPGLVKTPPVFELIAPGRAACRSGTCSTPSTWAWAWWSSSRRRTPARPMAALRSEGCEAYPIGEIVRGEEKVALC